ncbi:MAG: helix-turn-helix domain-containing protein [Bdellovibrionales bacterium]|nr:helix-turn-helix domain-containing protein [Bdellovibrionales bacterium]
MESDNVVPLLANSDDETDEKLKTSFQPVKAGGGGADGGTVEPLIFDNLVWMTSAEAARYLRKSVGALRVAVCRGQLPARKFHRRLCFKRTELDRLLDSSQRKGGVR